LVDLTTRNKVAVTAFLLLFPLLAFALLMGAAEVEKRLDRTDVRPRRRRRASGSDEVRGTA
jgi:hypothetical protein